MVGIISLSMQSAISILFKLPAINKDSIRCMMDGAYEKEDTEPMDIGDMITSQISGGNSTDALVGTTRVVVQGKEKKVSNHKKLQFCAICYA